MIILDIFKYFAAFVPKDALRRTFRAPDGKQYRALMDEVLSSGADRVPDAADLVGAAITQDRCLEILSSIRRVMRNDDDLKRGIAWMDYPATLTVFSSKALAASQGWSMEFDIYGIDIV